MVNKTYLITSDITVLCSFIHLISRTSFFFKNFNMVSIKHLCFCSKAVFYLSKSMMLFLNFSYMSMQLTLSTACGTVLLSY